MKEIGVFICNYNKAEMVIKCVQAIKGQTYDDLDIFVVDNASTDDSVEQLKQTYQDGITILQNGENFGGSGGFGRAIRTALQMGYKYFMLVDNDAILDSKAVGYLHDYLEKHTDVGICGAETLYLQQPNKIQDLGGKLDYERYQWGGVIGGLMELEGNAILECDYVASCSVMARTEAVRVFGGFPEENFIYWDDIEWCTKCWRTGYKVVVNGYAKTYHDMSGANVRNMFLRYYANRNKYKFFTKYLSDDRVEDFYEKITGDFFRQSYPAMNKGKYGTVFTAWNALDDFMHGITGRAAEGKIVPYTEVNDRLADLLKKANTVIIYMPKHTQTEYECLHSVMRYIMRRKKDMRIEVAFDLEDYDLTEYDLVLQLCTHVTEVTEDILPWVYVDRWKNAIMDESDFQYFSRYEAALRNFREMYRPLFEKQRKRLKVEG